MGTVLLKALALCLLAVCFFFLGSSHASEVSSDGDEQQQVYIVYMGSRNVHGLSAAEAGHHNLLDQVLDDGSSALDRILYSYKRSLNGFAAKLSKEEAHKLSGMKGIVSVFPSKTLDLLTTRSWDFLGFPQSPFEELQLEGDVIIGMLDTGIWPDSPSFSDEGFGPPPSRWKGTCHNFTCNNKIIGARAYNGGSSSSGLSALDEDGHGSHTASTVAGRTVANVSFYGLAAGTARGAVPGARLAIYKVCCSDADILAGFDDAIADGVDVISISLGSSSPFEYFSDVIAIGSFHSMMLGVLTSAAAGNSRLDGLTVCNVAPWMLSVAASSIDRQFIDRIVLGNGDTIVGVSINTFPTITNAPLAFPANGSCAPEDLVGGPYKGKIILCPPQKGCSGLAGAPSASAAGAPMGGAAGYVFVTRAPDVALTLPLPGLAVTKDNFDKIMAYVKSTSNPVGTLDRTMTMGNPQAPVPATFSSPGPNLITPWILKPDLSAPGVNIIASWSPLSSPSGHLNDTRKVQYNIISGTSIACPHASGAAAYVRSLHRDWSPAMIMSALITTATPMNTLANSNTSALSYGAGQLNPVKAHDPGLVYHISKFDYVAMLCAQGYNATQLALISGFNITCSSTSRSPRDLNYPTMAASVEPGKNFTVVFPRTVTNVGPASAVYDLRFDFPDKEAANVLTAEVSVNELQFSKQNQKVSFSVTVSGVAPEEGKVYSFTVEWYNNEHKVRSPVVVYAMGQSQSQTGKRGV